MSTTSSLKLSAGRPSAAPTARRCVVLGEVNLAVGRVHGRDQLEQPLLQRRADRRRTPSSPRRDRSSSRRTRRCGRPGPSAGLGTSRMPASRRLTASFSSPSSRSSAWAASISRSATSGNRSFIVMTLSRSPPRGRLCQVRNRSARAAERRSSSAAGPAMTIHDARPHGGPAAGDPAADVVDSRPARGRPRQVDRPDARDRPRRSPKRWQARPS